MAAEARRVVEQAPELRRCPDEVERAATELEGLALLSAKGWVRLKAGITLQLLQDQADTQTDLCAAQAMQKAKAALFAQFNRPRPKPVRIA